MRRVKLIHWNELEAREKSAILEAAGYEVDARLPSGPQLLRQLRENPPDAVVIDLSRLPAQGRDVGLLLRLYKSTRFIPLLFLEGDRSKVDRIKKLLPDACYASWAKIRSSLKHAIAKPLVAPVAAKSVFDAYAGRPLTQKLGIKPDSVLALVHAPSGFRKKLRSMPMGVTIKNRVSREADLTLWFNRSRAEYVDRVNEMASAIGSGKLWIIWPKQGGALAADLTEAVVRMNGLATGLVDYKICSIDETWSGLLFTRRRKKEAK
jgi:CheY-like chemotaxis protein